MKKIILFLLATTLMSTAIASPAPNYVLCRNDSDASILIYDPSANGDEGTTSRLQFLRFRGIPEVGKLEEGVGQYTLDRPHGDFGYRWFFKLKSENKFKYIANVETNGTVKIQKLGNVYTGYSIETIYRFENCTIHFKHKSSFAH
jgi:hypothetical protein